MKIFQKNFVCLHALFYWYFLVFFFFVFLFFWYLLLNTWVYLIFFLSCTWGIKDTN